MNIFDVVIGGLPLMLLTYHIFLLGTSFNQNLKIIGKMLLNVWISKQLKSYFKVPRNTKIRRDKLYHLRKIIRKLGSDYSFPSSHAMFFSSYFINSYVWSEILFVMCLAYARVHFKHHTRRDVIFGVFFGTFFNILFICLRYIFRGLYSYFSIVIKNQI